MHKKTATFTCNGYIKSINSISFENRYVKQGV
nr:MAG TPA: hypothetical protein [Caudoviricetes sp.]